MSVMFNTSDTFENYDAGMVCANHDTYLIRSSAYHTLLINLKPVLTLCAGHANRSARRAEPAKH